MFGKSFKRLTALVMTFIMVCLMLAFVSVDKTVYANDTTYYVSQSSGNDNNPGTQAQPWRTLAKVSSITFQPGDKILLKCGDTWNEEMTLHGNGNSSAWIELSSYGTGNKPDIHGQAPYSSGKITVSGENISYWKVTNIEIGNNGRALLFNGTLAGNSNIWVENCKFHDNSYLQAVPLTIGVGLDFVGYYQNITIKNCYAYNCDIGYRFHGMSTTVTRDSINAVNISDCVAEYGGWAGMQLAYLSDLTITRCSVFNQGKYFDFGPTNMAVYLTNNVTIQDSEFSFNDRAGSPMDGDGMDIIGCNGLRLLRCLFHDNDAYGIVFNSESSYNTSIEDSVFYNDHIDEFYTPGSENGEIHNSRYSYYTSVKNTRFYPKGTHVAATGSMVGWQWDNSPLKDITRETNGTNMALSATATASSQYDSSFSAANARDNNSGTAWKSASGTSGDQWLQIDFGVAKTINKLIIDEAISSSISRFTVQYWDSTSSAWYDMYNGKTIGASKQLPVVARTTQKVRLYIKSTTSGQPSVNEFKAYNANDVKDELNNWSLTHSHTVGLSFDSSNSEYVRGDTSRAFRGFNTTNEEIVWKADEIKNFTAYTYFWESEPVSHFSVYTSADGSSYSLVSPTITNDGAVAWPRYTYKLSNLTNVNYVKMRWNNTGGQSFNPELGKVIIGDEGDTYYVSQSGGNDSYDGKAGTYDGVHGPWKTLAKASSMTYYPGDRILLKRGDTWNEQFTAKGNGTADRWIELSSYGTGNKPYINRNSISDGIKCIYGQNLSYWKITNIEMGYADRGIEWKYTTGGQDGTSGKSINKGFWVENCDFHNISLLSANPWAMSRGIYIWGEMSASYMVSDITIKNCYFNDVTTGITAEQIYQGGHSKVKNAITDLVISEIKAEFGAWAGFSIAGSSRVTISNCTVFNQGRYFAYGPTNSAFYYTDGVTVRDCEFAFNDRDGSPMDGDGMDIIGATGMKIINCNFHDNDAFAIVNNYDAASITTGTAIQGCVFANNHADDFYIAPYGEIYSIGAQASTITGSRFYPRGSHWAANGDCSDWTWVSSPSLEGLSELNGSNLALAAATSALSVYDAACTASKVNDNNSSTYWRSSSGTSSGQWIQLDFGTLKSIDKLVIEEDSSSSISRYVIQYFDESTSRWMDIYNGKTLGSSKQIPIPARITQKIRLYIYSTTSGSPRIKELKAYSTSTVSTIVDNLDNWNLTFSHTSGLSLDTTSYQYVRWDKSRASRGANKTNEEIVWKQEGMTDFTAYAYFWESEPVSAFSVYTSSDGVNYSLVTPSIISDNNSVWPRYTYRLSNLSNVNYVKMRWNNTGGQSFNPQLGQVVINYSGTTDPLNDWTMAYSHTSGLSFDYNNPETLRGDLVRAYRGANRTNEEIVWYKQGMTEFTAYGYFWEGEAVSHFSIYTSSDGVSYSLASPTITSDNNTYWPKYKYTLINITNVNYVKVRWNNTSGQSFNPELGEVVIK